MGTGKLENIVPTKYKKRLQIPKIKLVPYFQEIQWDDFFT